MNDSDHIGYIVAYPHFSGVCCQACLDGADKDTEKLPVPIYRVNIGPYKQTCHGCGKVLVEPKTPIWPELFVKTDLEQIERDLTCTECPSVGLPAHVRKDDVTKTCPAYLAGRDRK